MKGSGLMAYGSWLMPAQGSWPWAQGSRLGTDRIDKGLELCNELGVEEGQGFGSLRGDHSEPRGEAEEIACFVGGAERDAEKIEIVGLTTPPRPFDNGARNRHGR